MGCMRVPRSTVLWWKGSRPGPSPRSPSTQTGRSFWRRLLSSDEGSDEERCRRCWKLAGSHWNCNTERQKHVTLTLSVESHFIILTRNMKLLLLEGRRSSSPNSNTWSTQRVFKMWTITCSFITSGQEWLDTDTQVWRCGLPVEVWSTCGGVVCLWSTCVYLCALWLISPLMAMLRPTLSPLTSSPVKGTLCRRPDRSQVSRQQRKQQLLIIFSLLHLIWNMRIPECN